MDDRPAPGGIPVIGRLRPLEFAGFAGLVLAAALSVWEIALLWPELDRVAAPGSGGGAQMVLAMVVYPALFFFASIVVSCAAGFAVLLGRVRRRLQGRAEVPPEAVDPATLGRHSDALTASLIVQVVCMVLPLFAGKMSVGAAAALLFTIVASGVAFLVSLGVLAKRLGRNWKLWVGLTVITPFGPFIAYFMMRKLLKRATRRP